MKERKFNTAVDNDVDVDSGVAYHTSISTVMSRAAAAVCMATRAGSAEPRSTAASMASLASDAVSSAATSSAGAASHRAPRRHHDCCEKMAAKHKFVFDNQQEEMKEIKTVYLRTLRYRKIQIKPNSNSVDTSQNGQSQA